MRIAGEYIARLLAIGAFAALLYCRQPAAAANACPDVRRDQSCNVTLLLCAPARSVTLQASRASEFDSFTPFHYSGSDGQREAPTYGSLWASPFLTASEGSPHCCSSCLHFDRTRGSLVFAENLDGFRSGLGDMKLSAANQQNPPADRQDSKSSASQGSPKHIFLVVPAFHVTYLKTFKPMTPREKFDEWLQGTYDPRGLGLYAFEAATLEHSSKDGFCGYGRGWGNYGKCFGATELDANISSFFGDFLFPVIMHQDARYFRLGHGGLGKRLGYAMSRVFITHADSGRTVFFASALSGTVIGATASNLYYPAQDRSFGHTLSRMTLDLGNTALFNAAAEFWPDIQRKLNHLFGRR